MFLHGTPSSLLQVLWPPSSPTPCGWSECECLHRRLILRLLIAVYGVSESCVWSIAISVLISIVDGLSTIVRREGPLGLTRGTSLALVGVSSGSIQFMIYEKMKSWGFERKRRQYAEADMVYSAEADKLVRCSFRPVRKTKFGILKKWSSQILLIPLCLSPANLLPYR